MEVRKILKSDLDELSHLMVETYNKEPWNDNWTEETAKESLNTILEFPKFYGNVVVEKGKIIAAIMGHTRKYSQETTYYIYEFFVSEEYRRKGVATKLYQTTIDELKKQKVSGAFFTTLKNSPAYNFYKKQGAWDLSDSACFYHKF
ncbi:GNAT family N-acetyltransferase [uncultured Finegoldia sp.]|uniref:GNAT family N-acetyltransferase n=1 Tax=uncultured Finegoldia sp. TaxID=328009 RepID=UPI00260CD5BA|nr:GNAT family N-acetyltransferase [uncultured Finegoldia sp.]